MNSTEKKVGTHLRGVRPAIPLRADGRLGQPSLPVKVAILPIQLYQKAVSPWLGQRCRFHPSCSNYCIDALRQHGMFYGLWLGVKRICKCHPFHPGGNDPVPKRKPAHNEVFTTEDTEASLRDSVTSSEAGGKS